MSFLKEYTIKLKTLGPVFIGSGDTIKKVDYFINGDRIIIPNMNKMYKWIIENNKLDSYEKSKKNGESLNTWIYNNKLGKVYEEWSEYTVNLPKDEQREFRDLNLFIKDSYKLPYVPGSSLKGALRTIIMYGLLKHEYKSDKDEIIKKLKNIRFTRDTRGILNNLDNKLKTIMRGLRISDSKALSNNDLFVTKKLDLRTDKVINKLPIYREYLEPGVTIEFKMNLDNTIMEINKGILSMEKIGEYIEEVYEIYNSIVLSKFDFEDEIPANIIYLGGGAGFFSKTLEYPLLKEDAIDIVSKIIHKDMRGKAKGIYNHKNDKIKSGISPRVLKLAEYKGAYYEIGKCEIEILEG